MTDDRPPWSLLVWLGLICGVTLGAVAVLILRDRRNGSAGALGSGPINIYNMSGGATPQIYTPQLLPALGNSFDASSQPGLKTKTSTVTVGPSQRRLMKASGGRRWHVQVRTIGPPGTYGMFGTDMASGPDATANEVVVPVGGAPQDLYLDPDEYLFGRGNVPDVVVSISARQLA